MKIAFVPLLAIALVASTSRLNAQKTDEPAKTENISHLQPLAGETPDANLPDAPQAASTSQFDPSKSPAVQKLPARLPPRLTESPLTAQEKFALYVHQSLNPIAFLVPVANAGITMVHPPAAYPHEWKAGPGGFGRIYGDNLARGVSQRTAKFLTGLAIHEDPRYLPSTSQNFFARTSHALLFTLVDKSDSGHQMPALSNLAGAAAGGFVGSTYLPSGFDDVTHAGQRSALTLAGLGVDNVVAEFCPEWAPFVNKLHISFIHPPCYEQLPPKP